MSELIKLIKTFTINILKRLYLSISAFSTEMAQTKVKIDKFSQLPSTNVSMIPI
jgi:hypothetical protein